jgi:PTH1 family peptidyl-tRNA hydrolase
MNLSGDPVVEALRFFGLSEGQMLVGCDDINLPLGRLRLRPSGGAGGHNGLADIIRTTGSNSFPRLRMGVGKPEPETPLADYVLSPFAVCERPIVEKVLEFAANAAKMWLLEEMQPVMAVVNGSDLRTASTPEGNTPPLHQD